MAKEIKTSEEMENAIRSAKSKVVIVDFFAPWCGPCKKMAPKLQEFETTYPGIVTLKVNVDECVELAEKYDVSAMPTFIAFKKGSMVDTVVGADLDRVEHLYKRLSSTDAEVTNSPAHHKHKTKNIQLTEVMDAGAGAVAVSTSSLQEAQ